MTLEQFKNATFSADAKVVYDSKTYDVISVDFEEALIALNMFPNEENISDKIRWVRCENCDFQKAKANNGWIKIFDEESLPKEENIPCAFFDKKQGIVFGTFTKDNVDGILENATHYQIFSVGSLKPPKY